MAASRLVLAAVACVLLAVLVEANVVLHYPRGSNNRLNEPMFSVMNRASNVPLYSDRVLSSHLRNR